MLTYFHKPFIARKRTKFATKCEQKFLPQLKCVATLPCEMRTFEKKTNCAETAANLSIVKTQVVALFFQSVINAVTAFAQNFLL